MLISSLMLALPLIVLGALSARAVARRDAHKVEELAKRGVDPKQPQFVTLRFVFPALASTEEFAMHLASEYECAIDPGAVTGQVPGENEPRTIDGFILRATKAMVLDPNELRQLGVKLSVLANANSGYYMGWELARVEQQ
jgi:hypothetical protein